MVSEVKTEIDLSKRLQTSHFRFERLSIDGRLTDVLGGRQLCTCHRETLDRQKCDDE